MLTVGRAARAAQRRLWFADLVRRAGVTLAIAAAAGLVGVVFVRAFSATLTRDVPWWTALVAPVVLAALWALIASLRSRPGPLAAASHLDHRLALNDKLSTAIALDAPGPARDDPFARAAMGDAERAARALDLRRAIPVRAHRAWGLTPALLAGAILAGFFVPPASQWTPRGSRAQAARDAERALAAAQVQEAIRTIEHASRREPERDVARASKKDLEDLRQLAQELESPAATPTDPRDAVGKAADAVSRLAQRTQDQAENQLSQLDTLRQALARSSNDATADQAGSPPAPSSDAGSDAPPAGSGNSEIARALRSGDLAAAAKAARELLQRPALDPQRQAAADDLRTLADDLREIDRLNQTEDRASATDTADETANQSRSTQRPDQPDRAAEARTLADELEQAAQELDERSTPPEPREPPTRDSDAQRPQDRPEPTRDSSEQPGSGGG